MGAFSESGAGSLETGWDLRSLTQSRRSLSQVKQDDPRSHLFRA
jgi:hypothetical protein